MQILNIRLMKRWENWATVLLMLLIAIFAVNALSRVFIKSSQD